jgi:hypothetical protein
MEMPAGFWLGNMKQKDHSSIGVDGKIILKWLPKKYDKRAWTGLILPKLWASGRLWCTPVVNPRVP